MRLLLITNRYPADADDPASPFVPHFVAALQQCGVDVDVLTPRYREGETGLEPGFIYRFESGSSIPVGSWNLASPGNWLRLWRFLRHGYKMGEALCRRHRYDHILALWALPSGYFARRVSRQFGIPYSVWCLGSDIYSWAKRPVIRGQIARVLTGAACVFGDGEDLCERVRRWLKIKCHFLPSFRPLSGVTVDGPPLATRAPRYLFLGRLHRAKGIFDLVAAFAQVHRALPGASLRLVGDGPGAAKLRQRVKRLNLTDAVRFTGVVASDGIVTELQQADFVVIPTKSDSLPLVFSEAVQACRPVIGTDVGDLGAFICSYRVGLVAPSTDAVDLSTAMLAMACAPSFDLQGRTALLARLDPHRAAETFRTLALGAEAKPRESSPVPADIMPRVLSS
jgi:glycosyltransferase involved in cell wall biosynthesis